MAGKTDFTPDESKGASERGDGEARGAEGIVPGHPGAVRRTTTKTDPSIGIETVGRIITTTGVRLNAEEKARIGLSKTERMAEYTGRVPEAYPSKMIAFSRSLVIWGMSVRRS